MSEETLSASPFELEAGRNPIVGFRKRKIS